MNFEFRFMRHGEGGVIGEGEETGEGGVTGGREGGG